MDRNIIFSKTIHPWDIKIGERFASVFCHIELYRTDKGHNCLSITGVEGPLPSGNARGSCGQIDMSYSTDKNHIVKRYPDHIETASTFSDKTYTWSQDWRINKDWSIGMVNKFLWIWKRFHLNDLHAECPHQFALGMTYDAHPGAVCPECGWKLGHGWHYFNIDAKVINWLKSLPDTDKTPAWI